MFEGTTRTGWTFRFRDLRHAYETLGYRGVLELRYLQPNELKELRRISGKDFSEKRRLAKQIKRQYAYKLDPKYRPKVENIVEEPQSPRKVVEVVSYD